MSISTRTTRSGGQLKSAAQAKEDGRYQEHLKCSSVLPSTEFPTLRMYCQLDGRDRIRVDNDVAYASILNLARTMLNHLVGSSIAQRELVAVVDLISHSPAAKAALASKLGEDRKVTAADIIDFLVNHTPAVVFKLLQGKEDSNAVVWGLVVKGDAEGAKDNEIFISLELTEALRLVVPPPQITPQEFVLQRERQVLLWSIAFLHELVHATSKFFFTPKILTPHIGFMVSDNEGHGEAGRTFEKKYLAFHLEAAWTNTDINCPDRMWRMRYLLAAELASSILILDQIDVQRLQDSFHRNLIWCPHPEELERYPYNSNTHTRYRLGVSHPMEDEDETDEGEDPRRGMITSIMCLPRVGLGLGISTL